jgi:hypothetical protein
MKQKLIKKILVLGLIIIFSSIQVSSNDLKSITSFEKLEKEISVKESVDLELISISKYYFYGDPRDPNREFHIAIYVKNNGSIDFEGEVELVQDINIKFLCFNIPRIRKKISDIIVIKPYETVRLFAFYNNDYLRFYFPGIYQVCYKVYPSEPYNKDDDPNLGNNVLCKTFKCFLLYINPENYWF